MKIMPYSTHDYRLPLVFAAVGVILRVLFMKDYPGEWDEVDFVLAMGDYDITADQPHFPGYPVYIWLCRILNTVTHNDVKAPVLTNALLGGLITIPLYYLARDMYSRGVAVLAACLFITNPLCWMQSERAMSDATGLFFLLTSVFILHRAYKFSDGAEAALILGAALLGVTFGVRLSYLPFLILPCYILTYHSGKYSIKRICLYVTGAFILGVLFWLIPLAYSVSGFEGLSSLAVAFTGGHFTDWGGSAATSPDLLYRLERMSWCLFCYGLGMWWQDTAVMRVIPTVIFLAAIAVFLRETLRQSRAGLILAMLLPYMLWVFLAQNIEKPRHLLPVIPFVLIFISAGMAEICRNRRLTALLAVLAVSTTGVNSLRLVTAQEQTPPPALQLTEYVSSNFDRLSTRIYCGESKRLFEYYAAGWDARMVRTIQDMRYDLDTSLCPPRVILATSEVKGSRTEAVLLHTFKGDRYVSAPYHEIILYRMNPENMPPDTASKTPRNVIMDR